MAHDDVLEVRGLSAGYGDRTVLRRIDLTVAASEIFGLLGQNGAGKTTLIRAICGRLKPRGGSVRIDGQAAGPAALRRIGLVPQEIALYPHLTIRENLEVFGRLSGLSRAATAESVREVVAATALADRLDQRVDVLSGGWKRRVNIAAAILHRPSLLILDEPMVGVDMEARLGLQTVILALRESGIGILLITHDLRQAETLCTRVGFLQDGVIAPQGAPRALLDAAFGERHEIVIVPGRTMTATHRTALQAQGFAPMDGGALWSAVSHAPLSEVTAALEEAGLVPQEIRFRKPGLDSLVLHLAQRPASAQRDHAA